LIQEARKNSGLAIGDRINVNWSSENLETANALRAHSENVASEVLATSFTESNDGMQYAVPENEIGLKLTFSVD